LIDLFSPSLDPFLPLNWPKKTKKNKNYKGERVEEKKERM